jgi:hypothetical protein
VRSLGKIFLYILTVLLVGAIVAPQAWHLIQILPSDWIGGLVGSIQEMPFHRYLSRSLQVTAILLLWPLVRALRVRSMAEFGIFENKRSWGDFLTGVLAGLLCCLLLQPILIFTGVVYLPYSWTAVAMNLPRLLATAAFVAVLEEFLFRGVLLGFFRQFLAPSLAVLFSSLLFAGVHFVSFPEAAGGPVLWWSGLATLGEIGSGFPSWSLFIGAFLVLFAAGLVLGWMTTMTGSLWAAIGLHGTWILGQQLFTVSTYFMVKPPTSLMPVIGPSQCHGMVPTGLFPLACILLAGGLALLLLRRHHTGFRFPTASGA